MSGTIKHYWDERASKHPDRPQATTRDIHLRELEINTIIDTFYEFSMAEGSLVLDVGCGDGYSTLKIAQRIASLRVLGIDYSETMINNACKRLECSPEIGDRVSFVVGDVMELGDVCSDVTYDVVVTDRCLINLETLERQIHAIGQIAGHTKQGGYYIAVENFVEGHHNMNKARRAVGLREIPVRWHNLFFKEHEFIDGVESSFEIIGFKDFSSSYYFATRVIYSKMCQMQRKEPNYDHEIHQLAVNLPWIGQFSPVRMVVLRKKSK